MLTVIMVESISVSTFVTFHSDANHSCELTHHDFLYKIIPGDTQRRVYFEKLKN